MIEQVQTGTTTPGSVQPNDTIYLCNFRVSVDGEWLCLKELQDLGDIAATFPPTPELERITYYPNYPVGPRERDTVLIERSNLVNISKLVVKEVIESSLKFGRQLDSDHIPLQHFFIVLEHVLRHGLKPKKGLLGPKKELWDLLQKVEKYDSEAGDITASVRDLPTVKTAEGRARVWLRLALMQKKLSDYFRLLVGQQEMLAEFYEPSSLIRSDEANLISALLTSLNVVDCNLCVKEEDLDSQQGVIDFSLYLRSKRDFGDDSSSVRSEQENTETETNMSTVLDQKNYIEELNRHLNLTVTNLQSRVESLTTTNALMKEDLSITRTCVDKIQAENKKLKGELEKLRLVEKKSNRDSTGTEIQGAESEERKQSFVQTSYESGIKELSQEFREAVRVELKSFKDYIVRLQEELTQREAVEKQLEKQNSLKNQMELSIQNLEADVEEKQATIGSLKSQLEDIKCINLEMYTKLAECEYEISQKGELVAKLENKTREISQMLNNLNKITAPGTPEKRKTEQSQSAKQNTTEKKEEKKVLNSETPAKPCNNP